MRLYYTASTLALSTAGVFAQDFLADYEKSNNITWVSCPIGKNTALQCATIGVPLDYTKGAESEILALGLIRQPASDPNPRNKSIIINPGGPGVSGIETIITAWDAESGQSWQQAIVGHDFHIVSFDPRGTGITRPYKCPEKRIVGTLNSDDGIEAQFKSYTNQASTCADPRYGSEFLGTAFVARDIKAIAEALGEDGLIRYWGFSYGTLLGATLSAMFPDQIDRVVLDGNINPIDYYHGLGAEAVADVDKGVAEFFRQCEEATPKNCDVAVTGQTAKQLQETYDKYLEDADQDEADSVRAEFFEALRGTEWKPFATKLKEYYDALSTQAQTPRKRQLDWHPNQSLDVQAPQALNAITCGDWVQNYQGSPENFSEWLTTYKETSKYGYDGLIQLLYQCSTWQVDALEKFRGEFNNIVTRNPILFVQTYYDPVTPLISAKSSSAGFVGSRVLELDGVGHCSTSDPSQELNDAVKKYFQDGTFPTGEGKYKADKPNVFIGQLDQSVAVVDSVRKRDVPYPEYFNDMPTIIKRVDESTPRPAVPAYSSSTVNARAKFSYLVPSVVLGAFLFVF